MTLVTLIVMSKAYLVSSYDSGPRSDQDFGEIAEQTKQQATFTKINQLSPGAFGFDLTVKVVDSKVIEEVAMGLKDATYVSLNVWRRLTYYNMEIFKKVDVIHDFPMIHPNELSCGESDLEDFGEIAEQTKQQATFTKINQLRPGAFGFDLTVKVVDSKVVEEVAMGLKDATCHNFPMIHPNELSCGESDLEVTGCFNRMENGRPPNEEDRKEVFSVHLRKELALFDCVCKIYYAPVNYKSNL
nr:hypothetical protein [Tanacetum cinerariifolium]